MSQKQVIIAIFPDYIDLVVYDRSQRVDGGRVSISAADQSDQWARSLRDSVGALRIMAHRLGVVDAPAAVLYHSPTQSIDLSSLAGCSTSEAIEAGKLGCADTLSYPAELAVCKAVAVANKADRQRHVIAVAEHEETAQVIAELVREARFRLTSITPLDAALMHHLVESALDSKEANRGWLYVGQQTSFFVIVSEGTLKFSRQIRLGCESFADGLTRPIYVAGRNDPIKLDIEAGREIFYQYGLPDPDQTVCESPAITGRQVLPLLQPLSQRLIIELRQSLRFGLDQASGEGLHIFVTGPGSKLPGLAGLVSDKLGIEVSCDPAYSTYDWTVAGGQPGEVADALVSRSILPELNILPTEVSKNRQARQLRRGLWIGAAMGVMLIAFDSWGYHLRLVDLRKQVDGYEPQIAHIKQIKQASEQLGGSLTEMKQLEQAIDRQVGWRFDLWAYMQELSRVTPDSVRFTSIHFQRRGKNLSGTLSGYARVPSGGEETQLEACVERLRASPLFAKVVLDHVELDSKRAGGNQRFTIKLTTLSVPRGVAGPVKLAANEERADTP